MPCGVLFNVEGNPNTTKFVVGKPPNEFTYEIPYSPGLVAALLDNKLPGYGNFHDRLKFLSPDEKYTLIQGTLGLYSEQAALPSDLFVGDNSVFARRNNNTPGA
ncbi:hypothetical protein A2767_00680 [Candidatus Roizmanbacteria bacterium RIFCSPHIGHO2_01_FULL_35_10]|uniref:Uncharacterized protein n=1 Tax=Candidatus Roizmanbacteria bacterium RIFCSPLOWO2_01_FULL_35_13 TaxID=1802055 RepID=A0A1F7I932_9BACT|nr:MAG: hypothetical protein A2767_00680 [Candidatus Roizmanbacteria bacterium RIFCSPHIGHO2_01_FULL_35_10]OGK39854.1 MAG: hypothetical protein A3A74_03105 [Candidatus Roizmanbacteria bacterium RIFCSPLOWO2_01_FULL_35_13]